MSNKLDVRDYKDLDLSLNLAQFTLYKRYLSELQEYPIMIPNKDFFEKSPNNNLKMFKLNKLSCKKNEDILQKLSTVYHASMAIGSTLLLMIDVPGNNEPTNIYLGVFDKRDDSLSTAYKTLRNGLESNFPGTNVTEVESDEKINLINEIFGKAIYDYTDEEVKDWKPSDYRNISSVSCVASIRDKAKTKDKNFIQGIERMIDTMNGETFTAVFIAEPIDSTKQAEIRNGYEQLYTSLSPFLKSSRSFNKSHTDSVFDSLSKGTSKSITDGTSQTKGHSNSLGVSAGVNMGNAASHAQTSKTGVSKAGDGLSAVSGTLTTLGATASATGIGASAGIPLMVIGGLAGVVGNIIKGGSITESLAQTFGGNLGLNYNHSWFSSNTTSRSETHSDNETKTDGKSTADSTGETLQIENINKHIEQMLQCIDEQLKRAKEGEDFGAYNCGAYFLSGKKEIALLAANTYRALMLGEGSSVESSAINIWDFKEKSNDESKLKYMIMNQYLRRFTHPVFALPLFDNRCETYTPATVVSGLELPLHFGLPTKSINGLSVVEHAEFGRNTPENENAIIELGNIYHMGKEEESVKVKLDINELASHTFITGSTGSGKSNTIYCMLEKLVEKQKKFLVIEPAKGEYKDIFGYRDDVAVYGTNPKKASMLRINPFKFPSDVHVLEHLDRLVEIFNVCWPMYAAMPAILKDSMVRAYSEVGWDLETSENSYNLYPTFADVLNQIKKVLEESDYSSDNKGDYTGALVTRIKSLTNGLNGLIFTYDDIPDEKLFDENVIIDLSRVGSSETKSLIMGILVLKLQEHRMSEEHCANSDLKHVTVLEEAHNILKRTSTEQLSESSNLLGKSVEMLANSIAEMRTFGEGFIIADQSPGLLDMSIIRNTNTKIIMRLPDFGDRELVGKAAGLNDDQIVELSKLEQGIASVTQSNWLEPVLCKVHKYDYDYDRRWENEYKEKNEFQEKSSEASTKTVKENLIDVLIKEIISKESDRSELSTLKDDIILSRLSSEIKYNYLKYLDSNSDLKILSKLIYDLLDANKSFDLVPKYKSINDLKESVLDRLNFDTAKYTKGTLDKIFNFLIHEQSFRNNYYIEIFKEYEENIKLGGRFG